MDIFNYKPILQIIIVVFSSLNYKKLLQAILLLHLFNNKDIMQSSSKDQMDNQPDYKLLQNQLTPIAQTISERAVLFIYQLFSNLIQGKKIQESLLNWTYQIKNPISSPICSKVMNQESNCITYRCYDCMQTHSACICQECFKKGDHQGHNYVHYKPTTAGCCDCGNQQVWNPKSFCPDHKKGRYLNQEIQPQTRKQFISQYTLAFYIFFALNKLNVANAIKLQYGAQIMSSLVQNSIKNYQMKVLTYELLQISLDNQYPLLKDNNQLTIFQRIFRGQQIDYLNQFPQLLFQIFPIEQSRIKVIKEYFKKSQDMKLTCWHPLANINFQYMTCVKIILKLIYDKELQPLSLNKQKCHQDVQNLESFFSQYYWNLHYINQMKSSKQYHILHLKMVNVAQMAFYRQFGRYSYPNKSDTLTLDELYLKGLGQMIKNAISQKQILLKCIKELFYYVKDEEINTFSQAQERALALFTLAFFDGNISQLLQKYVRNKFVQNLQISEQKFTKILRYMIKTSIKSCSLYGIPPTLKNFGYNSCMLEYYPENNFNYLLDLIYHKILMMISIDYCSYDQVIYEIFIELNKLNNEIQKQQLSTLMEEKLQEEDRVQYTYYINMKGFEVIKRAMSFLNTLTMINLDEIVVSNFLNIIQKQKIQHFYSRILSSFKQLNRKQFKALAISIINNEQVLEQFIKENTIISKGKLICKIQQRPLQTYIFNYLFQDYNKSILQAELCLLNRVKDKNQCCTITIFNADSIALLKQSCMNILQQLPQTPQLKNKSNKLFSQLSMELFKIYFYNREQSLKKYFQQLMNQDIRKIISDDLIKQIIIVEKEQQQYDTQTGKMKNEKEEISKKKRQKMQKIRREKYETMNKKQQQFLIGIQDKKEFQNQTQLSNCIVCKQTKQQLLNFISYVNFTDLVEKGILKDNVYPPNHLVFTTCGHMIHQSCYISACMSIPAKYCFLCKRETNILIPELSSLNSRNISTSQKQIKIKDFLNRIVFVLIEHILNGDLDQQDIVTYSNLINQISSEQNTFMVFIFGFARELAYNGLQSFKYFQKSQYHLYYQIFQIIICRPKAILEQILIKINQLYVQNTRQKNKLNSLERYIMFLLENQLTKKSDNSYLDSGNNNLSQIQIQCTHKIVSLFTAEKTPSGLNYIQNLNLTSTIDLFIDLPQHLNELFKNMGQCLSCPNITDKIYMCLLCGWSACLKCKKKILKHSSNYHIGGSVFIACFNGEIIFFYNGKIFQQQSIYQNYLGIPYKQSILFEEMCKMQKPQKFKLNHQKLEEIYKTVLSYGIHQKIFKNQ